MPTWQSVLPYKSQFICISTVSGGNVGFGTIQSHELPAGASRPINSDLSAPCLRQTGML